MTDREIALKAAHRIAARQCELHPGARYGAKGYARNGVEIPHPYTGGEPESWEPPPGAEYTVAEVDMENERVYVLRQPTPPTLKV